MGDGQRNPLKNPAHGQCPIALLLIDFIGEWRMLDGRAYSILQYQTMEPLKDPGLSVVSASSVRWLRWTAQPNRA